jgi:uncharacterized protein YjbI with pentapeptide repeats
MPEPIVSYWKDRLVDWEAIPNDVRINIGLVVLAALLLALAIWWLWWRLPQHQVAWLSHTFRDAKARADVEDNFRKTVGQALGGIVVLLGAGVAYLQFLQQQRAAHDLLISNQVSKGFEQLGNKDSVVVRLGGIYALEGVMNNSDQYHQAVLEALCAFVREGAKLPPADAPPTQGLPTDIQAALTVIGRRSVVDHRIDPVDLHGVNLTRVHLPNADLRDAYLSNADLHEAFLPFANLPDADLDGANLTNAVLIDSDLGGASLKGANLTHTNLAGAILTGQKQLDEACGLDAALPTGLTLKPCPPK